MPPLTAKLCTCCPSRVTTAWSVETLTRVSWSRPMVKPTEWSFAPNFPSPRSTPSKAIATLIFVPVFQYAAGR